MNFSVLLVEDNASFRQTLADTLLTHFTAMDIAEADNGEDALLMAGDLHPDIIFMDINLPGENGLEVTGKIKVRHEFTRVVILTSYDIPEYRQEAFRKGADCFISKADHSALTDIIVWVEKAVADKNAQVLQQSSTAIRRTFLRQRKRAGASLLPGFGPCCIATG